MERAIIKLDGALEDFVEEWLWIKGAVSVGSLPPHESDRKLTALFDQLEARVFELELRKETESYNGKVHQVIFEKVDEEDWQVKWRENFKPLQVGRFRLVGDWEAEGNDVNLIRIYPGQAFGTGQHETTRLVIEKLSELDMKGKRVLDVGCGTGVLSIVAERLGAGYVFGFDVDPDCRENMERHLAMNKTRNVTLDIGTLPQFTLEPFDVILANITINVLREVWPALSPVLKPDGVLLNSGILVSQREEAETALTASGFEVCEVRENGEWLMIEARLP